MIMVQGTNNTLTLNNVNIQTNTGYAVTTGSNTVYVNGGTFTKTSSLYSEFQNQGHLTLTDVTVTPQVAVDARRVLSLKIIPVQLLKSTAETIKRQTKAALLTMER